MSEKDAISSDLAPIVESGDADAVGAESPAPMSPATEVEAVIEPKPRAKRVYRPRKTKEPQEPQEPSAPETVDETMRAGPGNKPVDPKLFANLNVILRDLMAQERKAKLSSFSIA